MNQRRGTGGCRLFVAAGMLLVAVAPMPSGQAHGAEAVAAQRYDISAAPLGQVLAEFAAASGVALSFDPALTAGLQSNGLSGYYSLVEGFRRITEQAGLEVVSAGGRTYTLRRRHESSQEHEGQLPPLTIFGNSASHARAAAQADEQKRLHSLRPDQILGAEQMQRFPDEHLGKALDRLPGLFSTSPSEKQEVRVRGLDKEFTRIEVGGVNIPGSGRWRNLSLGTVASSLVDEVRVIRNPTADFEHDGIGGRVAIRYRGIPEHFAGQAQIMGGMVREGAANQDMLAGRASVWAGGPVTNTFGALGGLDISATPHRRDHQAVEVNADGSFRESFERTDRKDVNRTNVFIKLGRQLERGYLELEPVLFGETTGGLDERLTAKANGDVDHRRRAEDGRALTGGMNLRWQHQFGEAWRLDSRASGFVSEQHKQSDEVRLRYKAGELDRVDVSTTLDELTDRLGELRSALAYDWQAPGLGKTELGIQGRITERQGNKTLEENGEVKAPASGDDYTLEERYLAGWLRQQFNLRDGQVRIEPGVRVESYRLEAVSNDGDGGDNRDTTDNLHVGPSLHLAWRITSSLSLQGAVSRTQNRPQLDQITPSRNRRGNEIIQGNPALKSSTSINTDLGLVWATPDLFLATTAFHKKIDDLIVNADTGEVEDGRAIIQPENIEQGTLRGIEFEQRIHLGITGADWLNGLHLWSNQTLFDGEMTLQSGRQVPFFGEPDYLVAAGVDWAPTLAGPALSLGINHNGKRTEEDDASRKRFNRLTTLDLSASYPIAARARLRLEATNLTGAQEKGPRYFFDGDRQLLRTEMRTVTIPRTAWLGLDMQF